ncbi:hypothetical protein ACFVZN_36935 [Streptomyces virginiae]|uniref:hypothetical protein n=1 Tax=Streptomyces virginiae TaxID=1961 RepID=UPI00367767A5
MLNSIRRVITMAAPAGTAMRSDHGAEASHNMSDAAISTDYINVQEERRDHTRNQPRDEV